MSNSIYTNGPADQLFEAFTELALDLRWTWNHSTDELWRTLDPELWDATQNPWLVLQSVSNSKLRQLLSGGDFRDRAAELIEKKRAADAKETWYQKTHSGGPLTAVAYFSMEYMLSEALPIYSGGLGNVAGDQLKSASDLGVPVIGVGLLYQQGYFRQEIDYTGSQIASYPFNDPGQLPIRPLRGPNGDWLRLEMLFPGNVLWVRAWEANVGRRKLYLLDTNDPANLPAQRTVTSELYGGGPEMRLRQEMVLGIGGWRLLQALGLQPQVCHLNEGHAAFAVLERARAFMEDRKLSFDAALAVTRVGNLFTTHTAVEAGFDRFEPGLMERYFKWYAEERLKIPFNDLLALGRRNSADHSEPFNMAYLAIRGSASVNGVSRLHGEVSRQLFQGLFPRWPADEVPIGYVTNGIHIPTWDSPEADALWTRVCGRERWRGDLEEVEEKMRCAPEADLWNMRSAARKGFIQFTRQRLGRQRALQGAPADEVQAAAGLFDENRLTLGFARRFATYKRPNMLLHDPERLIRILTNRERPVQLVIAGKAHPQDWAGQVMIKQWNDFMRRAEVRGHAAFLEDYDALLAQQLVAGVDVWINTPRRPWEACGTSGMKVLANGGLNVSELDGWWAEAYAPEVGWAMGDGRVHGDDPAWDAAEADALYALLEQEVIPAFYERDEQGIPHRWMPRMKESMARLTPAFSANRAVRQYTESHYIPLASAYSARVAGDAAGLAAWLREIESQWPSVHFGQAQVEHRSGQYLWTAEVHLGKLKPDDVRIEIYADETKSGLAFCAPMRLDRADSKEGVNWYSASVPDGRPASEYTARALPHRDGVFVPLEVPLITWQK